ncbi:MAG: hypothetical protein KC572_01855 [Gammaproteobacteria bacterium]|nr:hypothetical protein [Gammaproteobacteria bacterium]
MFDFGSGRSKGLIEITSAGAVLMGLIFVGYELNQNTEAVQASTLQSITDQSQEYLLLLSSDTELNRIWRLANEDPEAMNELEASQYFFLLRAQWLRYQNAFLQWQRGTMSDKDWTLYELFICDPVGSTTARSKRLLWDEHRRALLPDFAQFVENCWNVENESLD